MTIALLLALATGGAARAADPVLKVGVTLHPYYSWTRHIVGAAPVEVRPILPGEVDAGTYQPRAEDIKKIADLDAIVVNGVGHDDFVFDMIKASGNGKIAVIRPNDGTALIKAKNGGTINSHTFISFGNAIAQTYAIEKALAAMRPALAPTFKANAAAYARKLRALEADAEARLEQARVRRVITVHDGYSYLLQELGIELAAVVEPAHGLVPSASELATVVDLARKEKIRVVLSEETFPRAMLDVLESNGGARVYVISHVATGAYTDDKFEVEMKKNADTLVKALVEDPARP